MIENKDIKFSKEVLSDIYYAPMAIRKKWKNERGQVMDLPLAYVTAKCYVVAEEVKMRKTDEPYKTYRVVFTWSQDGQTDILPICEGGKVVNSSPAKAVFKDSRQCQAFVDKQNAKLLRRKTQELFDDEKEAVKVVFNKNVAKCTALAMTFMSKEELKCFLSHYDDEKDMK